MLTINMLLPREEVRLEDRSTRDLDPGTVRAIMDILESSDVIKKAESGRRNPIYSIPQLFVVNLLRDAERKPYGMVKGLLTDELCKAIGLPKKRDGTCRIPSAGRLNSFVMNDWALCSDEFQLEFAIAAIEKELASGNRVVITIDSTPLEASRYNLDAQFNVHYAIRMDKAHIAMINGAPLFNIQTGGRRNDCTQAADLCRRLRSTGRLWCKDVKFMMDAGYCTFECFAEAFLATGSRPYVVLRTNSVIHEEAEWSCLQAQYCRMHRFQDYDPYKKNDERHVLKFLCQHGRAELVGKYLQNCEIRRQMKEGRLVSSDEEPDTPPEEATGTEIPVLPDDSDASATPLGAAVESGSPDVLEDVGKKKDTDRSVCEALHHAMKRWVPFDIRGISHKLRRLTVAFRFNAVQILSSLFARYSTGATC